MGYSIERALDHLRLATQNSESVFREGQDLAIQHVVDGLGRLLVVQKTGWGKSFVYFIATKMLREQGAGLTLLVSPLLSLMRNQIQAAERMGLRAVAINSDNSDSWESLETQIRQNEVDVLLISPERLANARFRENVLGHIAGQISLLVIDEAHCISDWGHDFRPHYRLIERVVTTLPPNLRLLATTATANSRVLEDLNAILGRQLTIMRGDLTRQSLTLQTIPIPRQQDRLAWLAARLDELVGHGIIYTLTVADAEIVASWLRHKGHEVLAYTGQSNDREERERLLQGNHIKALVATTALGMGFDKPDLAFVIHYQMPGSVVGYYQQVGRAGRGIDHAYGIMLCGHEDAKINTFFVESAFPTREDVASVLQEIETSITGCTIREIEAGLNLSYGAISKTIQLLSLESPAPIVANGYRWQLTSARLKNTFWERAERLTALRHRELQQMQEYAALPFGKHMQFLIDALDGGTVVNDAPGLPPLTSGIDQQLATEAREFLKSMPYVIEPRKKWPDVPMLEYQLKGLIKQEHRAEQGRALCRWDDAGWGALVKQGKYADGAFSTELVKACASMINNMDMMPAPEWVTCIPSLRHPELVPRFAQQLADELGLPFASVISSIKNRPEQKSRQNSMQQAHNLDGAFAIQQPLPYTGPVLLIDDMVDSRWTFTVASWLLRKHGSGNVWPIALSETGSGE